MVTLRNLLFSSETMESYEKMYKSVCRVCLKSIEANDLVSLLDRSSSDGLSSYGKAVMMFANVVVTPSDIFPVSICKNCSSYLKQAIYFKLKCESSDQQLKKLSSSGYSDMELKVKIVECALFTNYFSEDLQQNSCSTHKLSEDNDLNIASPDDNENFLEESLLFDENSNENQEDEDALLDRIEKMFGSHSENTMIIKKRFKKSARHRLLKLRHRQMLQKVEPESYVCTVCHRALANKHSYEYHMQRHNGCRYICEHCGKGFPVLAELQIHQVAVHDTGPYYPCRYCPYKAPRTFNLKEHERIHTGERPYTCDKCGLTFRRRFIWKKHLIYHGEKTVPCNMCPRKFYRHSEMLAHSNNVHERVYVFLCNKCGATYAKSSTVRRHMTDRHGIPREMQGKVIRITKGKADLPE